MNVKLLREPDLLPLFSLVNCKHCRVQSYFEALMAALDEMVWQCQESLATLHMLTQKALYWSTYEQLWFVLAPDMMQ